MCDKTVDACLQALKFVPHLFVRSKMLEKLDDPVFSNDDIGCADIGSNIVTFFSTDMGLTTMHFNNINLDDDNFDDDDPKTISHVRRIAWCDRYKQCKSCKRNKTIFD